MNSQKPIIKILLLSLGAQAAYCLGLVAFTLLQKPIISLFSASSARYDSWIFPVFTLGISFIVLGIRVGLFCWLYRCIKRTTELIVPSVCAYCCVALSPVVSYIGSIAEMRFIASPSGMDRLVAYSSLTQAFYLLSLFPFASTVLLCIGFALALYRERYVTE